jgi:flagellar basal body-associated protein FliL
MPFLIIGLLIGVPLGAVGGIVGYFWLISEANEAGRKEATYQNLRRQAEQESKWNKPTTY